MAASSSNNSAGGTARGFGSFGSDKVASSLFDAAFSKPVVRRFPRTDISSTAESKDTAALPSVPEATGVKRRSPSHQVFSPPISLPESTSSTEQANEEAADNESDEEPLSSQPASSQGSLTATFGKTKLASPGKKNAYDFDFEEDKEDSPPQTKKSKSDEIERKQDLMPKRKPVYRHTWAAGEDEEEEGESGSPSSSCKAVPPFPSSRTAPPISHQSSLPHNRVRNVKEAHQCLESGEYNDFKDDLDYILSALKGSGSINLKCLSCTSLARKCVSSQFRHFIRSQNELTAVFKALSEAPSNPKLALSASAAIYLLCRDNVSVSLDSAAVRLFSQLLRMERRTGDEETEKHRETVWEVFASYLEKSSTAGKKISFDLKKEEISASSLILEALVFVLTYSKDAEIKTELLNLGVLQWVVAKVEELIGELSKENVSDEAASRLLVPLERCSRILECCTMYHKKNQAFLISHRGSLLITSSCKLLSLVHNRVEGPSPCASSLARQLMHSLSLTARVLTNLSYENELCCTKLGQMPDFLPLCLSSFTFLAPKFADDDKKFDVTLLMSSLLVNLVERCNANRRKLIETSVRLSLQGKTEQLPALHALTKMFVAHEAAAQEMDTNIDHELCIEEPEARNSDGEEEEDARDDGRLQRERLGELSEGEVLAQLRGVMSKASEHMQDSVVASHLALLVGCILQQNEEAIPAVKEEMPDGKIQAMAEQLQRYMDFLKIAGATPSQFRSMERIMDVLERLDP